MSFVLDEMVNDSLGISVFVYSKYEVPFHSLNFKSKKFDGFSCKYHILFVVFDMVNFAS